MINQKISYRGLILVSIAILLSRLPFIFNGFGGEEDAWGTFLVTNGIFNSNVYEYSRLPGHPFQELVYALFSNYGSVVYNLLTSIISTIGIFFYMLSLQKLKFKYYLECGLLLSFIPVIYINGTNSMDYLWALSFMLCSFYFLISRNYIFSGIMIGLAIGCRITSGAIILPFIVFILYDQIKQDSLKSIIKLVLSGITISIVSYIPVIYNYGFSFFDYYKHFDLPILIKVFYNATFGIFGGLGAIVFSYFALDFLIRIILNRNTIPSDNITKKAILFTSAAVVLLYSIAYFMLPIKSEFLIPIIPFVIMTMTMYLPKIQIRLFLIGMIFSCFFGGINLIHNLQGVSESSLSITKNIGVNKIAFDLLKGPLLAEQELRKTQITFVKKILSIETSFTKPTIIISGWWYNYIKTLSDNANHYVNYVYYEPQSVLIDYKTRGYEIYYLPEQDFWNNKRFKSDFTRDLANPLPIQN